MLQQCQKINSAPQAKPRHESITSTSLRRHYLYRHRCQVRLVECHCSQATGGRKTKIKVPTHSRLLRRSTTQLQRRRPVYRLAARQTSAGEVDAGD